MAVCPPPTKGIEVRSYLNWGWLGPFNAAVCQSLPGAVEVLSGERIRLGRFSPSIAAVAGCSSSQKEVVVAFFTAPMKGIEVRSDLNWGWLGPCNAALCQSPPGAVEVLSG